METVAYKCGHPTRLAENRRGKARRDIIAHVTTHNCPHCVLVKRASEATHIGGQPYTAEEQAAFIAKRLPKIY